MENYKIKVVGEITKPIRMETYNVIRNALLKLQNQLGCEIEISEFFVDGKLD